MEPRKWNRLTILTTFWITCALGFAFQALQVCQMYFTFQTSTQIVFEDRDIMTVPSASFCYRYLDILNNESMQQDGVSMNVKFYLSNLTIMSIFKYTPNPEETLHSCGIRQASSAGRLMSSTLDKATCLNHFNVTKYYTQEFICYNYDMINYTSYSLDQVSHSTQYTFQIYYLNMNFIDQKLMVVTLSTEKSLPLYSRTFGKHVWMRIYQSNVRLDLASLEYRLNEVHLLEAPYDTRCRREGSQECKTKCLIERFKEVKRFPSTEMTIDPVALQHTTPGDDNDDQMRNFGNVVYSNCRSKCQREKCTISTCYTSVTPIYHTSQESHRDGHTFRVQVKTPISASIIIRTVPKVTFIDFLIYILSSVGVWFGLSAASFNPDRWMKRKDRQSLVHQQLFVPVRHNRDHGDTNVSGRMRTN